MKFIIFSVLLTLGSSNAYKILCIFPVPSRSHDNLGQGFVKPLLKAGHEVTWVTPFPDKNKPQKGLTIIGVSETQDITNKVDPLIMRKWSIATLNAFGRNISVAAATNPAVQAALVNEKFDAVITENFFSDLQSGFAAVQQAPWLLLCGSVLHASAEALVDDVRSAPLIPNLLSDFPIPMNLWQRLANTFVVGLIVLGGWLDIGPNEVDYKQIFGPLAEKRGVVLPPYSEVIYNISVLFVNSHPSIAPAQSLPPNVVDIAGYHIESHHAPLPKDLQELMDKSTQGVIYFSMGSVVKAAGIPQQTRKDIIRIFGALPYTVLWKFEEHLEGLPKNVHIRPWMPQPAILAHPNTKLFITHGGLLSTLEAIQAGVPLLVVPVFGDQPGNARRAERAGYAVSVPFSADMGEKLKAALDEVLGDDRYYKKAKFLSRLFNNRPAPPSKMIAHYVELAIETQGAYHIRSTTRFYKWYERYMLDQLAVLAIALFVIYKLLKLALQRAWKLITGQKTQKQKKH
ncbi:hypothetical protein MSG28_014643 [Choristoneura fumiferana]|uniref:Uncharacterized protein n=1 Tax=Choristoneura fumiferana TaxID=7141 RepID=A0ACC0JSB4_CHOFU|nr:hypothetical protein MSG28_014643 [Choristoneura fumiferana]